jgi:hypothetical protein
MEKWSKYSMYGNSRNDANSFVFTEEVVRYTYLPEYKHISEIILSSFFLRKSIF